MGEFDAYLDRLEEAAKTDPAQRERLDFLLDFLLAELQVLDELDAPPTEETATLKRVRQSRGFPLWRVSHPFRLGIAVRLIVWFPDDNRAVVALFAGDKARRRCVLRQRRPASRRSSAGMVDADQERER